MKRTFPAHFYYPLTLDASSQGQSRGASIGPGGQVLEASTAQQDGSWGTFLRDVAPTTKTPFGKEALWSLAAIDRQAQLTAALHELTRPGDPFPKFKGEQGELGVPVSALPQLPGAPGEFGGVISGATTSRNSDVPELSGGPKGQVLQATTGPRGQTVAGLQSRPQTVTDEVIVPSWEMLRKGERFVDAPEELTLYANDTGANPVEDPSTVMRSVLQEKPNNSTQSVSHPGAGSEAAGVAAARVMSQSGGTSGLDPFACSSCGNPAASTGGINNFLGGSSLGQGLGRFGPGGFGNLASLFNPAQFLNLLSSRFPQGGGGGGPQPTTQEVPPTGVCGSRPPTLSVQEARDTADLLGLPVTPAPWFIEYRRADSLVGTRGIEAQTGLPVEISDVSGQENTCLWVVTANLPDGSQQVVLADDTRSPTSGSSGMRLILQP